VQQISRRRVFVAADRLTGHPVDMAVPVEPAAHQHCMHRGGGQAELVTDRDRSESTFTAQVHDLADHRLRGPVRLTV
jgi:hypothetical protein